jgi:hypothetical protein
MRMYRQRWGSFAVVDHLRPNAYVADVLLYDRLLIPYPSDDGRHVEIDSPNEWKRWGERDWAPGRLDAYIDILGDLAERVPWNEQIWIAWRDRFKLAEAAQFDAGNIFSDNQYVTRMVLADDRFVEHKPPIGSVEKPRVVAAYPSLADFGKEYDILETAGQSDVSKADYQMQASRLASVLGYTFLVPDDTEKSQTQLLEEAVKLAREDEFRQQRAWIHDWQETVLRNGIEEEHALRTIEKHLADYGKYMESRLKRTRVRRAYLIATAALSAASIAIPPLGIAAALAPILQYVFVERHAEPAPAFGDTEVAAMIHTARERLA